jgi:hypothetical protein
MKILCTGILFLMASYASAKTTCNNEGGKSLFFTVNQKAITLTLNDGKNHLVHLKGEMNANSGGMYHSNEYSLLDSSAHAATIIVTTFNAHHRLMLAEAQTTAKLTYLGEEIFYGQCFYTAN